jgi:Spy/CpxP family protein refolding chaperone
MKKRITIYLVVIVTLINLSSLGTILYLKWTEEDSVPVSVLPGSRFEIMKEVLELTPQQLKQFEKIRTEFHSRLDSLDAKFSTLRKEMLSEIWQTQKPDSHKVESNLEQFSQLQLETQRWIVQHFYKFKKVLTPQQAEKFYKIVSERFPGQQRNPGLKQMIDNHKGYE